jgi:hypothetical protein
MTSKRHLGLRRPIHALIVSASLAFATAVLAQTAPASAPVPPPAPADLALGREIAGKLLPDGTYERLMGGAMSQMMSGMTDQMSTMPIGPLLKAAGLPPTQAAQLDKVTIQQIMDIVDPAYRQRMRIVMSVMVQQMGQAMGQFEPQMRDGLAQAYATHFTHVQLGDIAHFLDTPSGSAFAAQNMTMATDPVVVRKMAAFLPSLMQQMPAIMQKAQAATAGLPKPKTPATLTDDDRAKLAKLLGVTPDKLKKAPTP